MDKKKVQRQKKLARIAKGKASVKKGIKFENKVADLYNLLGAKVIQNIEICGKKVDILAKFPIPGSNTEHRVLVECKDEKKIRAENQRLMEFKGLLDTARKTGEVDAAEIITRIKWSDQAKGFAIKSGIGLLTYEEKIFQLIDFKMYLKELLEKFEIEDKGRPSEPALGAYYVDLNVEIINNKEKKIVEPIGKYVEQWLIDENNQKNLAILGEYGTGKSSFCQKLAHDLASKYLEETGCTRIPILLGNS